MGNLIKNEITKILKKKSIYVLLIIAIAYALLTNCIYKFVYSNLQNLLLNDSYETSYLEEQLKTLDTNKPSDLSEYISVKSELETYQLKKNYEKNSWQEYIIDTKISQIITEKNEYIYQIDKNEQTQASIDKLEKQYSELISILDGAQGEDGWKQFALTDINDTKMEIELLKQQKEITESTLEKQQLDKTIKQSERTLEALQMRIDKNIPYGNDDMNMQLSTFVQYGNMLDEKDPNKQMTHDEKLEYNNILKTYELSKYALQTGNNIQKVDDSRGILQNVYNEYGLFIIIMIIIIAGTIVSSEFEKGTIKLLLVKPYSRIKILLAKYIVVLLTVVVAMLAVIVIQLLLGGLFFGFDSLSIPVVQYDFNAGKLIEMNNFQYLGIQSLAILPEFILIATIAFMISTLSTNSALAITISLLGYMAGGIINTVALSFNVKFLKFFISMNWELGQYLFGGLPQLESMSFGFSIITCIVYFLLFIIPTFVIFKKKNVKNV